ncbi:MAG: hypothetical protein LBH63_04330, partial [Clostridiales Family XIII bacterium]|nr:hypothetical protein [Clostridiales Family XIII bacterium]
VPFEPVAPAVSPGEDAIATIVRKQDETKIEREQTTDKQVRDFSDSVATPSGDAATVESAGNNKLIIGLAAILLFAAIGAGILSSKGLLDLDPYAQWITDTFGNIFGDQ